MSEIREDIIKAALHGMIGAGLEPISKLTLTANEKLEMARAAVEAAAPFIIAAERERCAKIADTYAKAVQPSKAAFEGIAQAIRSGE